jgi:glutamate synthase domain-containing protein 2
LFAPLNRLFAEHSRYACFALIAFATLIAAFCWAAKFVSGLWFFFGIGLLLVGIRDVIQTKHAILRNYPILGHMRFFFEFIRPEIRQYFIESDTEAIPFSRQQRACGDSAAPSDREDPESPGVRSSTAAPSASAWTNGVLKRQA